MKKGDLRQLKRKDLTGVRFGRLVAKSFFRRKTNHGSRVVWVCVCDCGKKVTAMSTQLLTGSSRSCGCIRAEYLIGNQSRLLHGDTRNNSTSRLWRIWSGMRSRCRCKKSNKNWKSYKGRGISVCKKWDRSFIAFKEWAIGNGYSHKLSLDRKNNNGNYTPSNCRWATSLQQVNNRRKFGLVSIFTNLELIRELKRRGVRTIN